MSEQQTPTALAGILGHVATRPSIESADGHAPAAGSLGSLRGWWEECSPGRTLDAAWLGLDDLVGDPLADGVAAANAACDKGASLLVPLVPLDIARDDRAARSAIVVLANKEASSVLGQPPGRTDAEWMTACAQIRDLSARLYPLRSEPIDLLRAAGSLRLSYAVGIVLAGAVRGVPVLLDGSGALAAALIADRLEHRAKSWWGWASTSTDPACEIAADRLMLDPLLALAVDDPPRGAEAAIALLA